MFIQYNSNPFDVNDDDCAIRAIRLRSMEMNAENEEQRKMIRHWISQAEEN